MTDLNRHLQQLRALTHQTPDLGAWAELWHRLDGWPDDDTVSMAVDYVRGTWSWAASLGDAGALVTVTKAIGAQRPRVRMAAREVLAAHPPSEAMRKLTRDHLLPPNNPEAHDAIYKLFLASAAPTPLDEAEAVYSAMDPALNDAIRASLDATDWGKDAWREHLNLGRPFMVAVARWKKDSRADDARNWLFFSKIWRGIEDRFSDDPMCPWLHIDILANLPAGNNRLANQFYYDDKRSALVAPLVHRLITSTWVARRVAFEWLTRTVESEASPALLSGLCDPDTAIRKRCIEGLLHLSTPLQAPAALMLRTARGSNLVSCARLLERVPDVAWIAPLQRAQQAKVPARTREALGRALICCQIAALSPDVRQDEDPENIDTALRALIKKLPDEKPPTFLPKRLRKLHLDTGKALPPSAARWLARRLSYHRFSREDLVIDAIRDRLREGDRVAFAELIHTAFMSAGRPKKEHPWVLHTLGLFGADKNVAELGQSINEDGRHLYQKRKLNQMLRPHILSIFRQRRSPPVTAWCAYWSRFATSPELKIQSREILEEVALRESLDTLPLLLRDLPAGLLSDKCAERLMIRLLEDAIATRATFGLDTWQTLCVSWPEGLKVSAGLVFEALGQDQRWRFTLDHEGQARDLSGRPVELPDKAHIRLPHPSDLQPGELSAWTRALADQTQSLDQLDRGHHEQLPPPRALAMIERPPRTPLFFKLEELGYVPTFDDWKVVAMTRTFDEGIEVVLQHRPFYYSEEIPLEGVIARRGELPLTWDAVPARINVEVSRDLLILGGLS